MSDDKKPLIPDVYLYISPKPADPGDPWLELEAVTKAIAEYNAKLDARPGARKKRSSHTLH